MENMSLSKRFTGHLSTITRHKLLVQKLCFSCGMYSQGLKHDLSKYSPEEFLAGVKYYQGYRSPIDKEKEEIGYSRGWLHHKGRNKHHWNYWVDVDYKTMRNEALPMPFNYMLESVLDKIAASKIYSKEKYHDGYPADYFLNSPEHQMMHPETVRQIDLLLGYLKEYGEEKALAYYRELYRKWKKDNTFTL